MVPNEMICLDISDGSVSRKLTGSLSVVVDWNCVIIDQQLLLSSIKWKDGG